MAELQSRPLDRVYSVSFIDGNVVNLHDDQVANQPAYTAVGVAVDDTRDILGLWAGTGSEDAKCSQWLQLLTEIKNRDVEDACIVLCDGLKGLHGSIEATWPLALVHPCVLHPISNTFRLPSRSDWGTMARTLRDPCTTLSTKPTRRPDATSSPRSGETATRRPEHAGTSRTSRPRSSASTWLMHNSGGSGAWRKRGRGGMG